MFQFQCPNGHLLEGDESQAGQQCHCPMCHMLFIIPQPYMPAPTAHQPQTWPAPPSQETFPSFIGPPGSSSPAPGPAVGGHADPMAPVSHAPHAAAPQLGQQAAPAEPAIYHIPCPNGHELEVPEEMLKQEVICPFCEVQFYLRLKDSVEYKKQKQEEEEKKARKAGKAWLHWSVAIGVIVLLALLALVAYEATK